MSATVVTIRTKRGRIRSSKEVERDEGRSHRLKEALVALGITDRKKQIAKLAETPRVSKRLAALWLAGGSMGDVPIPVLKALGERLGVHWLWIAEDGNPRTQAEWDEHMELYRSLSGLLSIERAESDPLYLAIAVQALRGRYPARAEAKAFLIAEQRNPLLVGSLLKRQREGKITIEQMCTEALAWWRRARQSEGEAGASTVTP